MAIGSGLYLLGGGATVVILLAQMLLHSRFSWLAPPRTRQLAISLANDEGAVSRVQQLLQQKNIAILGFHAENNTHNGELLLEINVRLPDMFKSDQLLSLIQEDPSVRSIELQ